jgi:hypothetical protein
MEIAIFYIFATDLEAQKQLFIEFNTSMEKLKISTTFFIWHT